MTAKKTYKTIHIHPVFEHNGEMAVGKDWLYELRPGSVNNKPLIGAFKRRSDSARKANKISNKVYHWYII